MTIAQVATQPITQPWTTDQIIAIVSVTVAFLAVGVAIFQDTIRGWIYRPHITLDDGRDNCVFRVVQSAGNLNQYVLRLKIFNDGNIRAEDVQMFIKPPIDIESGNVITTEFPFHGGLLAWADSLSDDKRKYSTMINPGNTFDYVYFAIGVSKTLYGPIEHFKISTYPNIVDNRVHNTFKAGRYYFPIVLSTSNRIKHIEAVVEINCSGRGLEYGDLSTTPKDTEYSMFKDHFSISLKRVDDGSL